MRWLWIDRFLEFESGKSAKAVKNLSLAEDYFAEHFPGCPVMPAALMLEGLAQAGGILLGEANDFRERVVLAKIAWCRFTREALPGEQLTYEVELLHLRAEGGTVAGRVRTGGQLIGEAELFFAHVDPARVPAQLGGANFVFDSGLKQLLGLEHLAASRADAKPVGS
jgi:3-hydroxyacyl-[acyl-carrier-protein] dehydratase